MEVVLLSFYKEYTRLIAKRGDNRNGKSEQSNLVQPLGANTFCGVEAQYVILDVWVTK